MELLHRLHQDILLLSLSGDLIGETNGMQVVETANEFITGHSVKKCIVNLSDVRYMNSNGLGILIALLTKFRNKDGELVLVNPSAQISKLFMITKLNSIFTIASSQEDALKLLEAK